MVYDWEFEFLIRTALSTLCHVARWAEVERSDPT